jgi:hypothetical protein
MWTLCGFSDEISPDSREQCQVASGLGLKYLEIRIDEDFEPHLERMRHAADVARRFDAPYIRIFSFFLPEGDDPDRHRDDVLRRMRALTEVAEQSDVVLLHENEKDLYGDIPSRCLDIVTSVDSPSLRLAWDAANFVQVGGPALHRGLRPAPPVPYVQIKTPRPTARVRVRVTGGVETSAPSVPTASTGSSPSNRTWPTTAPAAASPAPSCGPAPGRAFTDILKTEGIEYR